MKRIDIPAGIIDDVRAGDELRLPDDTTHYVEDVLRKRPGDRVELFDGRGHLAVAEVLEAQGAVLIVEWAETDENESPLETTLFQAIPKGKRWKWLVQKATELGVDRIVPLQTRHTVVQIPDDRLERKLDRWDKIASSAARQSRRARVPEVTAPVGVEEALERADAEIELIAHVGEGAPSMAEALADADQKTETVGLWIGPEGGFHDDEVEAVRSTGAQIVSMGPRVLRSETAGIAAMVLVQSVFGDL